MGTTENKLRLYGFNNLTKTLSFNIYDVCYAKSARELQEYIAYIVEQYNSQRLTDILRQVTDMIGARILNISKQDYDPQGSSVTMLITSRNLPEDKIDPSCNLGALRDTVVGHLDKSHVTVHTYPEYHPDSAIATFRVDVEVSTCGETSPLAALNLLAQSFDSDIVTIDYKVRGFTRDEGGRKLFMDHPMSTIQDYIDPQILRRYDAIDINVQQANLFHTKLLIGEIELQNYLFRTDVYELPPKERLRITESLRREMIEIFSGSNIYERDEV